MMNIIKKLFLISICAATALCLSCYSLAAGSDDTVAVSRLEMVIKNATLKTGQKRTISVTISPGKADDKSITWASSNESVATVQAAAGTGRAVITAVGEGKAKITATSYNGKTAACSIIVSDDEVEVKKIEMNAQTATIKLNQKKILSVEISPRNADDKSIEWFTDNPDVATVEDDGIVTGISPGTAEITATSANGKTAVCVVTVLSTALTEVEQKPQDLDVSALNTETSIGGNASMTIGAEKDLSGFIKYKELYRDSNGDWQTQWQLVGTVSWASSFPDVVSVNSKGVAVAHRIGTSRITATGRDDSGRTRVQTMVVGVTRGISGSTENSFEISEGTWLDLLQLGELHSGAKNIKWSSSIPDIASVDSSGLVLARSIGRCTVTATYTDKNNVKKSITYKLRVTSAMLSNKTQNSTIIINRGDKIDLGRMYYPNYQNLPGALRQYSCTTGTQNILSADNLSLSAKAAGTGTVLIRQTDTTGETVCHKLTVVVKK